jgi:hypothetical protein
MTDRKTPPNRGFPAFTSADIRTAQPQSPAERAAQLITRERERMYWKMVSAGQLPSQGWRIGERLTMGPTEIRYECWPIRPAATNKEPRDG